jgi:2-keto-3-deoxy-L-rhamnonate aldolase RhmA
MASFGSVELLEIAAARGLDFAWLDMEHSPKTISDVYTAVRAADAVELPLMVRLPMLDAAMAGAVLDAGVMGYFVPHIATAEDAAQAVAYAKYAPDGVRGMCPTTRTNAFGGYREWDAYWPRANDQTVVGVIVEDALGLSNLEAICAVPGVDVVWLGTGDLSQSLGRGKQSTKDTIADATMKTLNLCRRHGKAAYCPLQVVDGAAGFKYWYDKGFRFMGWGDLSIFAHAFTTLSEGARSAAAEVSTV